MTAPTDSSWRGDLPSESQRVQHYWQASPRPSGISPPVELDAPIGLGQSAHTSAMDLQKWQIPLDEMMLESTYTTYESFASEPGGMQSPGFGQDYFLQNATFVDGDGSQQSFLSTRFIVPGIGSWTPDDVQSNRHMQGTMAGRAHDSLSSVRFDDGTQQTFLPQSASSFMLLHPAVFRTDTHSLQQQDRYAVVDATTTVSSIVFESEQSPAVVGQRTRMAQECLELAFDPDTLDDVPEPPRKRRRRPSRGETANRRLIKALGGACRTCRRGKRQVSQAHDLSRSAALTRVVSP